MQWYRLATWGYHLVVLVVYCDIDVVSQKPDMDYIKFSWNTMGAVEFQEHCEAKPMSEQVDFIHMIQVDTDYIEHYVIY